MELIQIIPFLFSLSLLPHTPYALSHFCLGVVLSENSSFWKTLKILQIDFIYLFLIKNKKTLEMHTV